ncbi:MAG: Putative type II secretion system protein D [Opitutia bacterium UBA7350]|nr:MAG: Putative type II secretion system protein D [Opitutae bacterium UBA7350]
MKIYLLVKQRLFSVLMTVLLTSTLITSPVVVEAQSTAEKVRIMAEALRARDSGNLTLAKEKAEELVRLVPNDTNAQRILASVNDAMEGQSAASSFAMPTSAPSNVTDFTAPVEVPPVSEAPASTPDVIAQEEPAETDDLALAKISPKFAADSEIVEDLILRGRAQFLNGDYDGAASTFKEVEARAPNNSEAKLYSTRIAQILGAIQKANLYKTREQMLTEVDQQWERPKVFDISASNNGSDSGDSSTQRKLNSIVIPQVNFSGLELTRVIETLSELSLQYDPEGEGVNIVVLFNPNNTNPSVNISLRNLSLDRILQFVTQQVNFTYEVGSDAVTIAPSFGPEGGQSTVTEFFPISQGTVIRLTGVGDSGPSALDDDPFAVSAASSGGSAAEEKTELLESFFQRAGVNFEIPGASLAFDGEQLIVTQTRQNLDRMRAILRNYSEVKQVEIEAKFLEVAQSDLEELGFDWTITNNGATVADFSLRSLNDAFNISNTESQITITGEQPIPLIPPQLRNTVDYAADFTSDTYVSSGLLEADNYDIDLAIRALSRKTGSDLMSAPKVTVLSGKRAEIKVGQEFRYPESYGDIESTASTSGGGNNGGGSASISITAGTPEDFTTQTVGVELSVTPNVQNDDTISLELNPKVTEFEGFVEYGGPSVAISGGTTVTVPAGFFQPIFSKREIVTDVTVFDGATLVMGGLTRDEVKYINDRVPVLGSIPGVGRLFRSEGETRQKRNLLIFVTANLVSPGGSLSRQSYDNAKANALFQNPTIMTPSGTTNRSINDQ